jgi:hypothetical protein
MNLLGIGSIIESVGKVADDLITTDKERIQLELEGRKIDQAIDLAQINVNAVEAKHSNVFVSGWRPATGWTCVAALAYQFLLYPMLVWIWVLAQANGWVPRELSAPPLLDLEALLIVLAGLLGIGSLRTFEKTRGVAR